MEMNDTILSNVNTFKNNKKEIMKKGMPLVRDNPFTIYKEQQLLFLNLLGLGGLWRRFLGWSLLGSSFLCLGFQLVTGSFHLFELGL